MYLIFKGQCAILLDTCSAAYSDFFPRKVKEAFKVVYLDSLRKGGMFGEHSAVNHVTNPYTVEVTSATAILYKISRTSIREM